MKTKTSKALPIRFKFRELDELKLRAEQDGYTEISTWIKKVLHDTGKFHTWRLAQVEKCADLILDSGITIGMVESAIQKRKAEKS